MSEWQPIETAPKNSKARLVWVPENGCIFCATWHEAQYDDERSGWFIFGSNGWLEPLQNVTHWMPTPEPPEAKP